MSLGFVQVCCDCDIFGGRKGALRVSFLLFFLARSSCAHLTCKTVFHAESLRRSFFFFFFFFSVSLCVKLSRHHCYFCHPLRFSFESCGWPFDILPCRTDVIQAVVVLHVEHASQCHSASLPHQQRETRPTSNHFSHHFSIQKMGHNNLSRYPSIQPLKASTNNPFFVSLHPNLNGTMFSRCGTKG